MYTEAHSETCMLIVISLQRDICLLHEIEDDVGNRFDAYECDDKEVTKDITKVCYIVN
jgi:ATP-dependent RNA helicase DDX49/DBP8